MKTKSLDLFILLAIIILIIGAVEEIVRYKTRIEKKYSTMPAPASVMCPICKCNNLISNCEIKWCMTNGIKEPECCGAMCQMK